jgi:hypothetical protein
VLAAAGAPDEAEGTCSCGFAGFFWLLLLLCFASELELLPSDFDLLLEGAAPAIAGVELVMAGLRPSPFMNGSVAEATRAPDAPATVARCLKYHGRDTPPIVLYTNSAPICSACSAPRPRTAHSTVVRVVWSKSDKEGTAYRGASSHYGRLRAPQ